MNKKEIKERLIQHVEQVYGRKIKSSTDFENFSNFLRLYHNETLGATTLKRIWGYIEDKSEVSDSSLSILARFVGAKDWQNFLEGGMDMQSSECLSPHILTKNLVKNDLVQITWMPDRKMLAKYVGNETFEILEVENSHSLKKGQKFCTSIIINGESLQLNMLGLSPYVIGRKDGVNAIILR